MGLYDIQYTRYLVRFDGKWWVHTVCVPRRVTRGFPDGGRTDESNIPTRHTPWIPPPTTTTATTTTTTTPSMIDNDAGTDI